MSNEIAILGAGMHPWGKWGHNFVQYGVAAAREAGSGGGRTREGAGGGARGAPPAAGGDGQRRGAGGRGARPGGVRGAAAAAPAVLGWLSARRGVCENMRLIELWTQK